MFAANPPVQVSPSAPAAPGYPSSYGNYAAQGSCAPRPGIPYARWLYFLSFSLPPVGVPIGLVYLFKDTPEEKRVGWWTLGWAVFGFVLLWMSWVELEHVMPLLKGLAAIGQPGGAGGPLGSLGGMMGEGQ